MPQRTLTEEEFTVIKQSLLRSAPDGLDEAGFQRWFQPRFDGAIAEAENSPAPVTGRAVGRFLRGAGELLNPVTIAQGLYQAARHPIDTGSALISAQGEQFSKAGEALSRMQQAPTWSGAIGAASEAIGHGVAGATPVLGPIAAEAGEQIAAGDVAGGLGKGAGLLAPVVGARPAIAATRRGMQAAPRIAQRVTGALERGAASRVADVMSPKVGANKVRFGNQAEKVAPQIAKDLAKDGAPLTREGLHTQIGSKLAEAEAGLDAAADARLAARTFETQPLIDGLLEKRAALTSEAVEGSRTQRSAMQRTSAIVDERGRPITVTEQARVPIGDDIVPSPNSARVAVIDQAIAELRQLGPVTRYDPIRVMRQAYDGPAKAVYSPSMTADYMKAQGGKLGAADVTGVLRERMAQWDPQTATANASYSLYRSADDVMQAAIETERTRPRVGRQIMARLTGTIFGQQAAGVPGAVAGYVGAPVVDAALSAGFTTQLKTARAMQQLADAVRSGNMERVNGAVALLQRELKTTVPVQAERATNRGNTQPALATP